MLDLNSDSEELFRTCEQSLTWRSKLSQWRTWSARWKRVSWMQHLSGRILKPSMDGRFVETYTLSLPVGPVSHSVSQENDKGQMTLDTFGRILRESLRQLDLFGSSEKMSPDTLPLDSPQFIEAYEIWVTQLRRDYSARQRSAPLIDDSDSLSWPTMRTADSQEVTYQYDNHSDKNKPRLTLCGLAKWPTPATGRVTQQMSPSQLKRHSLNLAMTVEKENWPTPQHSEYKGQSQRGQHRPDDRLTNKVISGLLGQDNPSTNGKRRGSWMWTTPSTDDINTRKGKYKQGRTALNTQTKGKLNPDWVEQLMGLPIHWTLPRASREDIGQNQVGK